MSVSVDIKNTDKLYGDFKAIDNVSLSIKDGEFFTLLGPSGCGKTTLLRMIAGFNSIEAGEILFDGVVINDLAAHKRDTGMVFQNYAVFPHLSVYENVGYGLKARKVPKEEAHDRIIKALQTVQIEELKDRMPSALSGGQQQRVALARAIVIEPKILLMDEPLSNLDAKLRVEMRTVIKKLQRDLNITTIYVTHDQEEALAISDRIAVLDKGKVKQVANPEDLYKIPANKFVSNFIGISNFLNGVAVDENTIKIGDYTLNKQHKAKENQEILISIRPEQFLFSDNKEGLEGEIVLSTFLGDYVSYEVKIKESEELMQINDYRLGATLRPEGETCFIKPDLASISIFDKEGDENLNV